MPEPRALTKWMVFPMCPCVQTYKLSFWAEQGGKRQSQPRAYSSFSEAQARPIHSTDFRKIRNVAVYFIPSISPEEYLPWHLWSRDCRGYFFGSYTAGFPVSWANTLSWESPHTGLPYPETVGSLWASPSHLPPQAAVWCSLSGRAAPPTLSVARTVENLIHPRHFCSHFFKNKPRFS